MTPLHELTDDQIDRMVAERLEPLNCIPPAGTFIHEADDFEYSPMLAWYSFDEYGIPPCWYPRQFTRDWSAWGILLEQMCASKFRIEFYQPERFRWCATGSGDWRTGDMPNLKRAICEAWLLASDATEVKE